MGSADERIARRCVCCGGEALDRSPAIIMPFVSHRAFGCPPAEIDETWGLRTIPKGMAYSVCNTLCCRDCGLLFLDVRFTKGELRALYEGYREEAYTRLREHYEPGYAQRNEQLNAGVPYIAQIESFLRPYLSLPVAVLDWGGDTGKNTPFKGNNSLFHVFDIGNKPVVEGAVRVEREFAAAQAYDLVVCSNVLEHVPYPAEIVLELKAAMRPETILYIEVPQEDIIRIGGAALHVRKRHWHEHINFYTEASLRSLLGKCGLEILELRPLEGTGGGNSTHLFQIACRMAS